MNQETANVLFEEGAVFVLADMPSNTEFGIDYNCWRTGPNFKGVKMIPPGLHYIYYSSTDKYGNTGLRSGFFYNFKLKDVVFKKYNEQNEAIDLTYECNRDDIERIRMQKYDIDRFLGAYPFDEYKKWVSLSNFLNNDMVTKLMPESGTITSATTLIGEEFKSSKSDEKKDETMTKNERFEIPQSLKEAENRLPSMKELENAKIRFSSITQQNFPQGSNAAQITQYSIDLTFKFEQLLQTNYNMNYENYLCELQFAFICFLVGHVYDAFEQWKLLFNILCNSESLILKNPKLFIDFINVIYYQLKEIPQDFFVDIVTKNNFLVITLHNLFDNVNQAYHSIMSNNHDDINKSILSQLKVKSDNFKSYLIQNFQFDFENEPDEYAPTICE